MSYNIFMAIRTERLERYKDFVDPEHTGAPYDPRHGLERLMGILSPDPKGIALAAMDEDWYSTGNQLQSKFFQWLNELRLSSSVWPISVSETWTYYKDRSKHSVTDGSLIELGAIVKKAEAPFTELSIEDQLLEQN